MITEQKSELDFESLIAGLGQGTDVITKARFEFRELTMKEQRKILNMGFNPIEIPARIENILNEYIKSGVKLTDSINPIGEEISIELKPLLIIQLRNLTLGDKYFEGDEVYTLYDVKETDFENVVEPEIVKFNQFILRLAAPSLDKDTAINSQLLTELGSFSKKLSEEDYGKVADLYQVYELMKYITEIELNGQVFNFERCPVNKKNKIINSLPQKVVGQINDYIEKVKVNETKALTMTNDKTGNTKLVDMSTLFFVRNARKK